jgi:hypothetical protein
MTRSTATAAPAAAPATDASAKGKRGRKSKDEIAALPPLDLSALTVQTGVEMPKQTRQASANPFIKHVTESYEFDDARAVTVAEANAGRVESMIRRAADAVSTPDAAVGVSIHRSEADEQGNVTITFAAKPRRKREKKSDDASE